MYINEKSDAEIVLQSIKESQKEIAETVGEKVLEKISQIEESKISKDTEILKSNFANLKDKLDQAQVQINVLLTEKQENKAGINCSQNKEEEMIAKSKTALENAVISSFQEKKDIAINKISDEEEINKSVLNTFNNARFGSNFKNKNINLGDINYNIGNLGFLSGKVNNIDLPYSVNVNYRLVDNSGFKYYTTTIDYIVRQLIIKNEQEASKRIFSGKGVYANSTLVGTQGIAKFAKDNVNATFRTSRLIPSDDYRVSRTDLMKLKNCLSKKILASPDCALYIPTTLFDQFFLETGADGHSTLSDQFEVIKGIYYFKAGGINIPVVAVGGKTSDNQNYDNVQDFLEGFENYESFTSTATVTTLYSGINTNADSGKVFALLGDLKKGYTFGRGVPTIGVQNEFASQVGMSKPFFGIYQEQFGMVTDHTAFAIGYIKS
ncbi:MAG: hypothetical protein LW595_06320 [Rickettsiales bacterium]|nr:hypothetical protein [Rickettsiales bacterium]